jgi:ribonuclease Z
MKISAQNLTKLQFPDFSLLGYSVAGEESVIVVPELNCVFDIGRCPQEALPMQHILLTHGHIDHAVGLLYYFSQRSFLGMADGTALVPISIVAPLEDLLYAWSKVDGFLPPHKLVGMRPNEEYPLNNRLVVRTFATNHVVDSLGFVIVEIRHKLKPEFRGLSETQIVGLKQQNIEITAPEEIPLVAYVGDTAPIDFHLVPDVAKAKVLLIECTFFSSTHEGRARAYKHLHLNDLAKIFSSMENEHIVITHVTKRTNLRSAKELLVEQLPADIAAKVTFLMG